jgi:arabinan endo-1,5-alpha-L-arabinosidase
MVACTCVAYALGAHAQTITGDLAAHDPSTILKENGRYLLFHTGPGISTKTSTNLIYWSRGARVFTRVPDWTTNSVPGFRGYFWAPDIVRVKDKYFLYYSVSTFGKQRSAIGLATSSSLAPVNGSTRAL